MNKLLWLWFAGFAVNLILNIVNTVFIIGLILSLGPINP